MTQKWALTEVAQDTVLWRASINAVMNLWVPGKQPTVYASNINGWDITGFV